MLKNDMGFKKLKNINKLHSFCIVVLGMSTTRIIQFVCNPVDTPRTITHTRMQFNA